MFGLTECHWLRPIYFSCTPFVYYDHVQWELKVPSTQQNHCSMLLKVTWRGEELKMFNRVEPAHMGTHGEFFVAGS